MKNAVKSLLSGIGYEIRRIAPDRTEKQALRYFVKNDDSVILDVGAHHGETALTYHSMFERATIYSFEPYRSSFDILVQATAGLTRIVPLNSGLSDAKGKFDFSVNIGSPTNSLLRLESTAHNVWNLPDLRCSGTVQCDFTTIDAFCEATRLENIRLLKVDTQGSEYRVLEGGRDTFSRKRIDLVFLEVLVSDTYVGQKSVHYYLSRMDELGFKFWSIYNNSYGKNDRLLQFDCLFVRDDYLRTFNV